MEVLKFKVCRFVHYWLSAYVDYILENIQKLLEFSGSNVLFWY